MKKLILILTIIFCFNTAHSQTKQFSLEDKDLKENPQTKAKKIDTITNIEAASKCLILSGEVPNQAMKDVLGTAVAMTLLNTLFLSDVDFLNGVQSIGTTFVIFVTIPVSIYAYINYWVQTYKGNVYLQKAGRYLSNKGENSIEKIDGKYYYIKYISK